VLYESRPLYESTRTLKEVKKSLLRLLQLIMENLKNYIRNRF